MRPLLQFIAAWICAASLASIASADSTASAPGPTPFPTAAADWPGEGVIRVFGWMKDNRQNFWRQREQKQGAWVLAGDSLFGNWRAAERDLGPRPIANRAIGGDVSRGLLFRFQEDVLDLNPSGIVLLIGTNDLSAAQPTEQTARNIQRLLEAIKAKNTSTPVILCTLPPRDNPKAPIKHSELTKLNASIKKLAATHDNVVLLDLFPLFATADGQPQAELYAADRLHIGPGGYAVLSKEINERLAALTKRSK